MNRMMRKIIRIAESDTAKMNFSAIHSRGRARCPRWMPIHPTVRLDSLLARSCTRSKIKEAEREPQPRILVRLPLIAGGTVDQNRPILPGVFRFKAFNRSLPQFVGQWIVPHFLDQFLAFGTTNPAQVGGDFTLVQIWVHINKEVTPDRISAVDNIFLRG